MWLSKSLAILALATAVSTLPGPRPSAAAVAETVDEICLLRWVNRTTTRSSRCVECHDGSVVPFVLHRRSIGTSHPVDVDYPTAGGSRGMLRPAAALPDSLPLVEGQVTCTTCHSGTSRYRWRTSMPLAKSALCVACHDY